MYSVSPREPIASAETPWIPGFHASTAPVEPFNAATFARDCPPTLLMPPPTNTVLPRTSRHLTAPTASALHPASGVPTTVSTEARLAWLTPEIDEKYPPTTSLSPNRASAAADPASVAPVGARSACHARANPLAESIAARDFRAAPPACVK